MRDFVIKDEPFAVGFLNEESPNVTKKVASGLLNMAKNYDYGVTAKTGLPDCSFRGMNVTFSYGNGIFCYDDGIDAKIASGVGEREREDYEYIKEQFAKYNIFKGVPATFTEEERDSFNARATWGGTWIGHAVPDLIDVAKYGTRALRRSVSEYAKKNPEAADLYDALLIYLDAVDIMGKKVGERALEEAEKTEDVSMKRKLQRLYKTFLRCPEESAETFADAVAVYVMLFTNDMPDSPGHFDQYMIDFWRRSDHEESREVLCDLWEFFHDTRTWNLCIGGSDENFGDLTNELTYEILEVTRKYKYQTPNLTMRCHRNTPEKLFRTAAQTIGTGCGMPTFYNDEAVCPALERLGIPPCDSHEYVMNGCNQVDIQGKSHMGLEDGEVNLGKVIELVFSRGICTLTGKKIGLDTGDVGEFDTFEKFFDAVCRQMKYNEDLACDMSNRAQKFYSEFYGNPLRTLTIKGCLEKGKGYKEGGPLYGHGQILIEGMADAIDSVAAVKKFVYDEKKYTIEEVRDALSADFVGFEGMLEDFRESELRFGNDNCEVDDIAKELIDTFNKYLLTKPTWRGGHFSGGCSPFSRAAHYGTGTGALPNGHRKGEAMYADSIGADPGKDVKGPTALLKSCLKIDQTYPASGFILNIKFDKKLFNTEKGMEGFLALCKTYFKNRGQQLSVTVVSREELLDAQKDPDSHRDLIVRVGGYSDYFVNLPKDLQDNVIARTNYEL